MAPQVSHFCSALSGVGWFKWPLASLELAITQINGDIGGFQAVNITCNRLLLVQRVRGGELIDAAKMRNKENQRSTSAGSDFWRSLDDDIFTSLTARLNVPPETVLYRSTLVGVTSPRAVIPHRSNFIRQTYNSPCFRGLKLRLVASPLQITVVCIATKAVSGG